MSLTITQALATARLDPVDARALLRAVLNADGAYLIAYPGQALSDAQSERFAALAARRRAGEPVAYIVGAREFFSLEFQVTPAVLIPRPETELLVEFALEHIAPGDPCRVLDLGTGSGCVAISIAKHRPRAAITAVDRSAEVLAVARANVQRHAVGHVELLQSDWFAALGGRRFDIIVANPPYVAAGDPHLAQGDLRFEPQSALAGGADGLECIRSIVASAHQYLASDGWLAFEQGYDQAETSRALLRAAGYLTVRSVRDLGGIQRASYGRRR